MRVIFSLFLFVFLSSSVFAEQFGEWRVANTDFEFKASKISVIDNDNIWLMETRYNRTRLRSRCPNSSNFCDLKEFPYHFNEMFFRTTALGWLVGDNGMIIRTPNAGVNWFDSTTPTKNNLMDVSFVETSGWVVGEKNTILYSNDDGKNWVSQKSNLNKNYILNGVAFMTKKIGWIIGFRIKNSKRYAVILYTRDSGNTWVSQTDNIVNGNRNFIPRDITVSLAGWVYVVGNDGAYLMSTDEGETWNRKDLNYGKDMNINSISFATGRIGCFVGDFGIIQMTYDAGFTWHLRSDPVGGAMKHISDVRMLSPKLGYAVNTWGYVLKYEN